MQQHYKTNWQQRVGDKWQELLADDAYTVTGTLKFNKGTMIGSTTARNILNAYWHKLDRTFFGHPADKSIGIERWIFSEYGSSGNNLHFQFKAKAPIEPYYFCCIANVMWSKFHQQTSSGIYSWITPTVLKVNSAGYTVKDTRHFKCDAMGLAASHQNEIFIDTSTFQDSAQAKRIINKASLEEIIKAQPIVDWQIEQTIKKINQRQRRAEVQGTR
jgi:hypothetical protein